MRSHVAPSILFVPSAVVSRPIGGVRAYGDYETAINRGVCILLGLKVYNPSVEIKDSVIVIHGVSKVKEFDESWLEKQSLCLYSTNKTPGDHWYPSMSEAGVYHRFYTEEASNEFKLEWVEMKLWMMGKEVQYRIGKKHN